MDYTEIMNGFAAKFAVEGLDIHDGACTLEIDGTKVVFLHDMAEDALALVAEIGAPPDANGPFGSMMLKANFLFGGTAGATLCQNPETDAYAICRTFPLASLDPAILGERVEALVDQAENWRRILGGAAEAEKERETEPDAPDAPAPDFAGFPSGGFMQV